jgi:hypothetical protein
MTIEEYNSIKPTETAGESTNTVIPALLGSQRMPNFDKLILAPSPQLALTTMYMHATEMHVTTKIPTKWLMITWVEDVQQHRLRTGNQVINMFNRGYMYPQQQIESGCNLRFTTFELASQQIWEINADGGNTMLQQICNYFQWNKDGMWTYNIPVQMSNMNVESTQQEKRLVLQCLEYGGAQMLHHFTTSTRDAVMEMLQQLHSTSITSGINTGNILFQGAKTV